ncbi:MAG TPA: dioxygenase, partial [Halieaceae bacterium]|nr:dioxygenase [Halieaceae bacterium]
MQSLSKFTEYPSVEQCLGGVAQFANTPQWIYGLDNPYLHGVYAPTTDELDVSGLAVEGELPADLEGAYFRNGPNPVFEPKNRYHPFDGDGMVHGVYFRNGQAAYRNRYVDTLALQGERADGRSISPGVMGPFDYSLSPFGIKDTSNTDIFIYNGDLMSLWYNAGHPYRLDAQTLGTKGYYDLEGRAQRRMSAHSKVDLA